MSAWQDLLVAPDVTIEDAVRAINRGAMRIALVVDDERRLLGTVTDGDVRRALLDHVALTESVRRVMNPAPKTVPLGTPREDVLVLMRTHSLMQVPIIGPERRVVGIETLLSAGTHPRTDNWVFLMAGGFGKRLRPLTDSVPKPMLEVGGKPVLETILESFLASGFHRFYIAVHYQAAKIKDHFGTGAAWDATIRYIEEESPLGTAGALGLLPETDDLPLVVMNADLITRLNFLDLLSFHAEQQAAATICGCDYAYEIPFGIIDAEGHRVRRVIEKPVQRYFINAGIYVLSPNVARSVPTGRRLDMPELLQSLVDQGRKVSFFPLHEYWLDIGHRADFERATREFPG